MAKRTLKLQHFEKGNFISWFATTQAANKIVVKLYDSSKVYFEASKQSTNINPPLNQGYATMEGNNLCLDIDVPAAQKLDIWISNNSILSASVGDTVGQCFTICGEDQSDDDYNDIQVSVIGWKKKG